MRRRKIIISLCILLGTCVLLFMLYIFVGQEYVYAKKYADTLLEFDIPEKTEVIERDFDYGVLYGGGPWGSGGYPTVVAYQQVKTNLSERDLFEHYNTKDFEIYFEGTEEVQKNGKDQIWYEGSIKNKRALSAEENNEQAIEAVIQYRKEFSYPFFIDLY
ncbi:hypothetical protein ACFQMN_11345 [Halobacillus campisalis]|uniref:Uncharacterized protein n=2 Tax=Halobacillus campisalis TaxID=435909 RepID=A0ABW2K6Y4_9BACI|nr:hypothetical protein [Halobacillus campisalis]